MFQFEYASTYQITPLHDLVDNDTPTLGIPQWLQQINKDIDEALQKGGSIRDLVLARAKAIDELLIALFNYYQLDSTELALLATGGYGRGELSLHSDVDIVLLNDGVMAEDVKAKINLFVAKLWDVGIEPALAVRTVDECLQDASEHTIATALLESRFLVGNRILERKPRDIVNKLWSQVDFYQAKMAEAKKRSREHNDTEYNLEPDIKNSPGGLRDIQLIGWVSKRYFRVNKLYDLVQQDFLTEREFDELTQAEDFLWRIRHYLHTITKRDENKLLFDHQRKVANAMGYGEIAQVKDSHGNAAIETLMRDYYRCAMLISTLAEMLTSHYYELLIEGRLPKEQQPEKNSLTELFNQFGSGIESQIAISHNKVFAQHPDAILQMFLLMGQKSIKNVRTRTLRALKIAVRGIDENYRVNPVHQALFLANIKETNFLYHRLRTMKRYGVLGNYLPAFGQVTGLMQYDLFHRYTVDAHTLLLIRYLHRLTNEKYSEYFGLVSSLYQKIERKDILLITALFHDIAKGRGGCHSILGEKDAVDFCLAHGMSKADSKLIGWLVKYHLLMSVTAQKKDISDPEVLKEFANTVGNVTYLNHLYVLTVADMNATNPQLWNSWRASLMRQLYSNTRHILRADVYMPADRQEQINSNRAQSEAKLDEILLNMVDSTEENSCKLLDKVQVQCLWDELGDEYFLREIPDDILWHTETILQHHAEAQQTNAFESDSVHEKQQAQALVAMREHRDLTLDAVQVFIYTPNQDNLFAVTMAVLDKMDLDVLDARIITATRDFALDSYVVLDRQGTLLTDTSRQQALKDKLIQAFANPQRPDFSQKRMPRQLKHFHVQTKIRFNRNATDNQHIMSLITLDRPSLLAQVAQSFLQHNIEVHSARITTLGEKAEDIFYISDKGDNLLSDEKLASLEDSLKEALSS